MRLAAGEQRREDLGEVLVDLVEHDEELGAHLALDRGGDLLEGGAGALEVVDLLDDVVCAFLELGVLVHRDLVHRADLGDLALERGGAGLACGAVLGCGKHERLVEDGARLGDAAHGVLDLHLEPAEVDLHVVRCRAGGVEVGCRGIDLRTGVADRLLERIGVGLGERCAVLETGRPGEGALVDGMVAIVERVDAEPHDLERPRREARGIDAARELGELGIHKADALGEVRGALGYHRALEPHVGELGIRLLLVLDAAASACLGLLEVARELLCLLARFRCGGTMVGDEAARLLGAGACLGAPLLDLVPLGERSVTLARKAADLGGDRCDLTGKRCDVAAYRDEARLGVRKARLRGGELRCGGSGCILMTIHPILESTDAALALEQALARIERRAENAATVGKDAGAVGRDEGEPGPRSVGGKSVADGCDETDIAQKGGYKRRCVLIDLHTIDESLSGNTVCHTASQGLGEGYDGSPSRHISER